MPLLSHVQSFRVVTLCKLLIDAADHLIAALAAFNWINLKKKNFCQILDNEGARSKRIAAVTWLLCYNIHLMHSSAGWRFPLPNDSYIRTTWSIWSLVRTRLSFRLACHWGNWRLVTFAADFRVQHSVPLYADNKLQPTRNDMGTSGRRPVDLNITAFVPVAFYKPSILSLFFHIDIPS